MMPQSNRRRTAIGIATLAFGASGLVASGSVNIGSEESLGDDWIQIAGAEQSVTFSSLGQTGGGGNSSGDGNRRSEYTPEGDPDGSDETAYDWTDAAANTDTKPDDDTSVSTSGKILVDPSATNSLNSGEPVTWDRSLFEAGYVVETPDGYLCGIRDDELNQNATT